MNIKDNTKNNYRLSDIERRKTLKFVLGYEINRSPTNPCNCSICESLIGLYPLEFSFIGWHEECKCIITAYMLKGEEFTNFLITGIVPFQMIIREIPLNAQKYIRDNYESLKNQDWFILNKKNVKSIIYG